MTTFHDCSAKRAPDSLTLQYPHVRKEEDFYLPFT